MGSYRDLEIYKLAFDLSINVHKSSLRLPNFVSYMSRGVKSEDLPMV